MIRSIRRSLLLAIAIVAPAAAQVPPVVRDSLVTIRFFDVGQGDAALIVSPTGRKVLIDGGPAGAGIARRLRALRIDTLDLVIATHNHSDHIGGLPDVLRSIPVKRYIENGMPQATQTYRRIVESIESRNVEVLEGTPRTIGLGGGAELRILPSSPASRTQNDRSLGILLVFGSSSALFTGDAEVVQRAFWRDSAGIGAVQVLKVSHHGSVNGTDKRMLSVLRPCIAVISVGARNGFGHPSPSVTGALRASGAYTARTDYSGEVEVRLRRSGVAELTLSRARGSASRHHQCGTALVQPAEAAAR